MASESDLKLAIAVHQNPGIYALLLGSGVSRAAGIPTGWEIVLDLIRKVAAIQREDPEPDPAAWYTRKYSEPPDYGKLLSKLAGTPAERMALLRSYFEPTEEEQDQGLKTSTPAHKAVARLASMGAIRVILTTNFDRLIETALEAEGIVPDVISSADDLKGALPLVHTRCALIKVHGDYRDTRIKNTPRELARYPKALDELLDRVLDDYGLIVCGWSAEWDSALRKAILRSSSRRFTTYWLARGRLTDQAKKVATQRRAEVVPIEDADRFFEQLMEHVESLRELEKPSPESVAVAVATVKRYVAEPRYRVKLHDLVSQEVNALCDQVTSNKFETAVGSVSKDDFLSRMRQSEALTERLAAMLAALSYHDAGDNGHLLTRSIERLAILERNEGNISLLDLQYYPALLVVYAGGVAALAQERFSSLAALLWHPKCRDWRGREKLPSVYKLHVWGVMEERAAQLVPRPVEREHTPLSNHIFELLRPALREFVPGDAEYEETFDLFEYMIALTYVDLVRDTWSPAGRFWWRWRHNFEDSPMARFARDGLEQKERWPPLAAGFFGGSATRFKEVLDKHTPWLKDRMQRW